MHKSKSKFIYQVVDNQIQHLSPVNFIYGVHLMETST